MKINFVYYKCQISFNNGTIEEFEFETEELLTEDEILEKIDEEYRITYSTYYEVQDLKVTIYYHDIQTEREYDL